MKKNQYIAPAIEVSAIVIEGHLMQASPLSSVSGLEGVTKGQNEFQGGVVDVKSNDSYNVWDDDWSR